MTPHCQHEVVTDDHSAPYSLLSTKGWDVGILTWEKNNWSAHFAYQSGPGLQVLQTSFSPYLLQSIAGILHPLCWTFLGMKASPPLEALPFIIKTFSSLSFSAFSLSLQVHALFLFLFSLPWQLTWLCSLGPLNLPESCFQINLPLHPLIWFELAYFISQK